MKKSVLVGFKRSPFTIANKGLLSSVRPEDILSQVINDLIKTTKVNKADIEDILAGCAYPEGAQGYNIAKIVSFMTSMPEHVAGMTINRWCGSSMQSIHSAAGAVAMDAGKVFVCCGIESMTFVPINGINYDASDIRIYHKGYTPLGCSFHGCFSISPYDESLFCWCL